MAAVTIRPATLDDCVDLAHNTISANESAFRGRVPDACLDWMTPELGAKNWARNFEPQASLSQGEHLLLAVSEERVVGHIMSATLATQYKATLPLLESYHREISIISVHARWQRQGVGRLLVAGLVDKLRAEGETCLLVRCLKDNPYCVFYKRLGAAELGTLPYDWEGYQTEEVLYGWSDITSPSVS